MFYLFGLFSSVSSLWTFKFGGLKSVNFCTNLYTGMFVLLGFEKVLRGRFLLKYDWNMSINKTKVCIFNTCVYNAKVQRFLTFFSDEKCFFRQCLKQSKKKVIQIAYWLVYNVLCKSKIQWGYIDFFFLCVSQFVAN